MTLVSSVYSSQSGKRREDSRRQVALISVDMPKLGKITLAGDKALNNLIADMLRKQKRLLEGKTIVRKIGQAAIDPVTLLPVNTPRQTTGSKPRYVKGKQFTVDGFR